ncbi:MAG TPA: nitroreductase family protein [Clostridia bacterium]|nr:nitroreductase family protein [Clostridia bacterium]
MDLQVAICHRRTVRDFSKKEVPSEAIREALNAGLKAPSHNHQKEWSFVLVKDSGMRLRLTQTEEMAENVPDAYKKVLESYEPLAQEMYLDAIPKQKRMILTAPELLVVVYQPKIPVAACKKVYDLNCLAAVWCCIENILLSLAARDIFGVTFIPQHTERVKEVLGIPQELEVAAMIPFGYRADSAKIFPQKEVRLDSVLHADKW